MDAAMASEGDLAVRGRSEAEDSAAVNKERQRAVSLGAKPRRPRGPRAPRAPRGPRAPKATRAPKAGAAGGGGGGGRKPKPSSSSSSKQPDDAGPVVAGPSVAAATAVAASEPGFCGNEDFDGFGDDADFIDDSGLEAGPDALAARRGGASGDAKLREAGGATGGLVSPAALDRAVTAADPRGGGGGAELQRAVQDTEAPTPSSPSDKSSEFLTQSPLSPDMLEDFSLRENGPEGASDKDQGVGGGGTGAGIDGGSGNPAGGADGDESQSEREDGRTPRMDAEARSPAKTPRPPSRDAGKAGGCDPDVLAAMLMGMGVVDADIVQVEGRPQLDALLREAEGNAERAVELYFERQKEEVGTLLCLPYLRACIFRTRVARVSCVPSFMCFIWRLLDHGRCI